MTDVTPIEINKPAWSRLAEDLFLDDYEDPKDFYTKFSEPISVYSELAKRVVLLSVKTDVMPREQGYGLGDPVLRAVKDSLAQLYDSAAYTIMNNAFKLDVASNSSRELLELKARYLGY